MVSVIVFGPTGQVGSMVARTAAEHGAEVWLAMRDIDKAIPGFERSQEEAAGLRRVRADLHDPETVSRAVVTSGAKRAFVYLAHGTPDHMKGAFEALRSAGIEFVVLLSSFTIDTNKELRDIPATEVIPYVHAQAEANLEDVFGSNQYVAMRPGAFASNLLWEREGIVAGHVSLYGGDYKQDNITPSDIGRASGVVLVSGPRNGQRKVYLYGPEILSLHDSVVKIGRVLDKDLKVTAIGPEEGLEIYIKGGVPEPMARYMVRVLGAEGADTGHGEQFPNYAEGVDNVKLYTGRPSTSLEDWVRENRELFDAPVKL